MLLFSFFVPVPSFPQKNIAPGSPRNDDRPLDRLPKHVEQRIDIGVAVLKHYNFEEGTSYRDYKGFRTDAKVVAVDEERRY